jgi:hypothetical protein
VKVDYNLDIVGLRPTDSFKEIVVLSLDERFAGGNIIRPIAYRNAHMVESGMVQSYCPFRTYWDFRCVSTHPAPAIALKSSSVIHVSQC